MMKGKKVTKRDFVWEKNTKWEIERIKLSFLEWEKIILLLENGMNWNEEDCSRFNILFPFFHFIFCYCRNMKQ